MTRTLGLWFLLLVSFATTVFGTGKITVTFLGYDNPSGQELDGGCCDEIDVPGCPVGKCDHSFEFCITDNQGNQIDCFTYDGPEDQDRIREQHQETIALDVLEEEYYLTVNVSDMNTDSKVPIDVINIVINRNSNRANFTTQGTRKNNPTTITLSTGTSCSQFFYLDNCTKKCVPADNCDGHYTCNPDTGDRVCNEGWRGPTCTELIPGSARDCSIYHRSGFVSSSWSGLITCPHDTKNFSMNITKTESGIGQVEGYVTTDQITTPVSGLFSDGRNSLILHDAAGSLSMDSTMYNETRMTGAISENGTKCDIDLNRIEGYFDACGGRGTCIRYGLQKHEFYCCCDDGTNSCNPTTTTITTVKTSTTPESSGMTTSTDITSEAATETQTTETTSSTETTTTQTTPESSTAESNTAGPSTEPTTSTGTTGTTVTTSASQTTVAEVSTPDSTTTLTTKTTTPTTTAPTTPTTTEKPTIFEPSSVYRLMFEAVEEEMDGEEDNLVKVLKLAWEEANVQQLSDQQAYNISILHMKGAIGENGVLIMEISYTVSINVTGVNIGLLVTPTKAHLTKALQTFYHTELYTGVTVLYLENSFSIYISGRPPLVDQYLEINQDIYGIWNNTMGTETFNITTSAVEEYIGTTGEEITRIYYFIYDNNTLVRPADVTEPNVTSLATLGRYLLYHHRDVNSIVRYRITYNINIIGEVTSLDQVIIRDRIRLTWNETDMLKSNVSIAVLRCERYIEPDGNFVTKVIYQVTSGKSIVYSVLHSPPNTTMFEMSLNVNNSRGEVFRLYHGMQLFRYSFHLGLYVLDKIDTKHDIDKLVAGLENAWKGELITQDWDAGKYKLHYITVKRYITADGFADMLLYFLTKNHQLVDGTQYKELDVSVLKKYIQVTKMSGENYRLVSAKSFNLIEERLHFTITFQGVVLSQDRKFLTGVILGAWKQVEGIAAVLRDVHIRAVEEMVTEEGGIVSRLFYTFTRTDVSTKLVTITNPLEKAVSTGYFYEKVTRNLISLSYNKHQNYKLYTQKERLYSRRYTFDLYFEMELARLDFDRVEAQLSKTLRQHLSLSNDVKVKIIKQEEHFLQHVTQTSGVVRPRFWRIFYVIYQDSVLVYPGFHKKVLVNDLVTSFSVTGIAGKVYKLYTGEISQLLDYSYQFFLHFQGRVSSKDWFNIKARLETAWQIQFAVNVSVEIQEVEEVISTEGVSYWRLVYSMTDVATNKPIYPGNWKPLNLETVRLDFTSVYGYTYKVVNYTRALMRTSSAFRLIASESVSEYYTVVNKALSKTWCDIITDLGYTCSSNNVEISLIRTPYIKLSSGISVWRLYYFLKYDGISVDFLTWPKFDLDRFTLNIGKRFPIRFYHWFDFDLSFWNLQFFLSFKSRVEKKDYASVTAAILETFTKNNAEYTNSTDVKVVVDTQNEVLTDTGKWEWQLGYHIEVNGKVIKPEETHVNTTQVQTILKTNTSLVVSVETSSTDTYTSTENLGSIFLQSTIHKEDYAKFKASLEEYYKNKTGGSSNISVVLGPVEEVITKDGKSEWKFTYSVKENGKTIRPSPINTTEEKNFLQWFHFKSKFGFEYKLKFGSTTHVDSKTTIFGINMKAKVSTSSYSDIEAKLSEIITKTNPELIVSNATKVSVKILDQQELVTDTGETVWRLHYGVYVNGAKVDASYLKTPSRNDLEKLLVFKGPNGIENSLSEISVTETHTEVSLHELRLNRPMSQTDVSKISVAVRASWAKVLNASESELQIDFKRSNEYVTKNGKSSWGWTYSLKWNSTILTRTDLSVYELKMKEELKARLVAVATTRGDKYTLVDETSSLEYAKHFPIYFTVKVAQKDITAIKEKLERVWSIHKGINVSIDISVQKEVIDKTGKSYWELVYFVVTNDTKETTAVLDSRVEGYKNVTTILAVEVANVTDVNGQSYKVMKSVEQLFRADQTFSIFLSAKFGKKEELKFKETIETAVRQQLKVTTNTSVTVDVLKHIEVTTGSYESAWKYLFSVKVDGRTLNPMTSLNGSWPQFDLKTSTGYRVTTLAIQTDSSYYDFRNSFSFYLEKNVSFSTWSEIKAALNRSWSTVDEYKTCACLDFDLGSIHEVIDSKGKTFYKVLYFLKQNTTMVDAMTHRKLSTTILKSELKDIRSVQGQHNTVVEVTGDVTTRVKSLFGFFLKKMVRIDHWSRMEKTIEKTVTVDNNQECCTSVRLLRQIPFITINGQVLWKVEYQLVRQNITLDAEVTTDVNVTSLQSEIDVTFASGYVIEEVQQRQLIDYRNKVELYFSAPIAEEHLIKIKHAINISYAASVTDILILSNQEMIDIHGTSLWRLSVFIYEGDRENVVPYVPGWGLATFTVNMTRLMTEVKNLKIAGVHGDIEVLEISGEGLRPYQQSLSILVKNVIKTVDIVKISAALTNMWNTTLRESVEETTAVTVVVSRQEELVDIERNTVSRLVYFLKIGEETVTAEEVPILNRTRIQATLTSLFEERYQVVMETEVTLLKYESLFAFYMTSPVLLQDTHEFQDRLELAWKTKFESNSVANATSQIRILLQEELTNGTEESTTLWRVLYSLERNFKPVDSRSEIGLSVTEVKAVLDTKFTSTSTNYSDILVDMTVVGSMYRYTDLFSLHIKHRVASIDYTQFESSLAAFWNHSITGAVASVCKQEEELDSHGESVWKLSYVIKQHNTVVSSQKIEQTSADVIMKSVNVTSPRGMTYTIVDVTETVRIEEVYHLYVTRKVFRDDVTHFTETLKETIKDIVPENNLTGLQVEWKGQTQFKHITDTKLTAWRQLFLVKLNNKYITPINYGSVKKERITLNFTSIRGDNYDLINSSSLSVHYARADEQFSVTVIGRIQAKDQAVVKTAIQTSWNKIYIDENVTINIQSTEEYIGAHSAVVTRMSLFAVRGTSVIDPDTMKTPSIHEVLDAINSINGPHLVAYTGTTAIRYESCFTLLVKGTLTMAQQTNLQNVLKQAWQSKTGVYDQVEILIHKTEKFVGEFGVELTQVLYTVRIKGRLSQADDDVPPSNTEIEAYQPDALASWKMYSGKVSYRSEVMFSIKVESLITSEVTSQQVAELETALLSVWTQQHRNDCLSCEIRVVSGNSYRGYNSSTVVRVTEVSYTVTRSGDVITPWVMISPTRANMAANIDSQSAGVSVWLRSTYKVRNLYLVGYTSKIDMDKLRTGIHRAWLGSLGESTNVSGEISDVNVYVDKQWQKLTRVQYFVSLNSTDPDQLTWSAPTTDEVNHALNNTGIQQHMCNCEGLKLRKMHVRGARVNYTAAAAALKQAWIDKNKNASASLKTSLEVNLKQLQITRRRRAVTPELVDDQGKPISPADYTVSIDGQDPDPLFVQPPSQDDLDQSLKANGVENCNCNPGKVGHVKLKGHTKDDEKEDVAEAVKDAIAKSNPGVSPADLDVQILHVDNHDENGGPVSDVKYAVRRHDNDDVEALSTPSEAHLSEALKAKGKALASTEETSKVPPPAENTDWQVPTAVLCSLFAFIIICMIVFYYVYVKRHRKNADLKEAEENIQNNIHNEEHFAKPAVFNNPMYGTHQAKHVTVGTEGL